MPGVKKGERFTVIRKDKAVLFRNGNGVDMILPLNYTDRFQVYRPGTMAVAKGDVIRTTCGGKTQDGGTIDNGCVATVTGFGANGSIKLSNGKILQKDFGHIASGYYATSWASQSRTVDRVLVAEGAEAFRAGNLEQFYVSVTRGREGVR